jgi:hypothetical protein
LRSTGLVIGALVVNRVHPRIDVSGTAAPAGPGPSTGADADAGVVWRDRAVAFDLADEPDLADTCTLVAELSELAAAERAAVAPIVERIGGTDLVVEVPVLEREVADLDALAEVVWHLVGHRGGRGPGG